MRKVLNILFLALMATGIIFLFVFANIKQKEIICPRFDIEIDYAGSPTLITKSTIKRMVTQSGIRVKDQPVQSIPLHNLQKLINTNPYIKKATISTAVNGVVKAHIQQREPLFRIIDNQFNQWLVDTEGYLMPVNIDFPVRVVLANGNIGDLTKHAKSPLVKGNNLKMPKDLSKLHRVAVALKQDTLTNTLIEQIYMNDRKEIELIPKLGEQTIILGDTSSVVEKLQKLKAFYEYGMPNFAWNNYKIINLQYNQQIVCTK